MEKLFDYSRSLGAKVSWAFGPHHGLIVIRDYAPETGKFREADSISARKLARWAKNSKENPDLEKALLRMESLTDELLRVYYHEKQEGETDPEIMETRGNLQRELLNLAEEYL